MRDDFADARDRARLEQAEMARLRIKDPKLAGRLERYWSYNILMKKRHTGASDWADYMLTLAYRIRVIPTPEGLA